MPHVGAILVCLEEVSLETQFLQQLNASWYSPSVVTFASGSRVSLVETASEEWSHLVREETRMAVFFPDGMVRDVSDRDQDTLRWEGEQPEFVVHIGTNDIAWKMEEVQK